jgi:hypothetical protein
MLWVRVCFTWVRFNLLTKATIADILPMAAVSKFFTGPHRQKINIIVFTPGVQQDTAHDLAPFTGGAQLVLLL